MPLLSATSTPEQVRLACRSGDYDRQTSGLALGAVQANLIVLPYSRAFEFLLFAHRNPKPCPILDVTEPGDPEPKFIAPGADLRTDLPRYRVFQNGEQIAETSEIQSYWRDDLVCFLIGCSFSFENALLAAGIPVRHIEEQKNVPMYRTNRPCRSTSSFSSPLVVSMRPLPGDLIARAVEITSPYRLAHGAPVQIGDPAAIGIENLAEPDYGEAVTIKAGEIPVFWACGVTTQAAVLASKPDYAITHAPGHMFISNLRDEELKSA